MPPPSSGAALEICQPGFDVRNCPDWAYLFNSGWPSLAIAFEITLDATGMFGTTIPHNLGFSPLAMAWLTDSSGNSYGRLPGAQVEVNTEDIFIFTQGLVTIRVYNIDISKETTYPLPQSAQARLPYNDQFGAKIVKSGRQITSNNLNDFILHTRGQSPAVLDVATEKGKYFLQSTARHFWPYGAIPPAPGWDLIVYPLRTNYLPWYTGAINLGFGFFSQASGTSVYFDTTSNSLVLNISAEGAGSLIILRDPLFYPNVVQAVY